MFRKTSPQMSMLESHFLLPEPKRRRLEASWAHSFRTIVLPLIDEELFRECFHDDNGRPNKSIRLLTGLHILKEMNDLTDAEIIDALEFNLQFHYALGVEPGTAHVCQKTLHNHRVRLLESDRAQKVFEAVTRGLAEVDGLSLGRQRLDSTHVISNIAVLTRLGLFVETVTHFMRALQRELPDRMARLERSYVARYLEREGYFADAKRNQARRRIRAVASDIYRLVVAFEGDAEVVALPAFALLQRLFEEQCEVVPSASDASEPVCTTPVPERVEDELPTDESSEDPVEAEELPQIRLREGKEISSGSLQTPHDPEATYGHKGKGYEVQVAETCEPDNAYQVVTGVSVNGANVSDQTAVVPMLEQLAAAELAPDTLFADTGYGSGENIVASASRGVDLQAPVRDPDASKPLDPMGQPVEPTRLVEPEPPSEDGLSAAEEATASAPEVAAPLPKLSVSDFTFDEDFARLLRCPAGEAPLSQHMNGKQTRMWVTFSSDCCEGCPLAARCPTRRRKDGRRTLQSSRAAAATQARQREQQTSAFKDQYRIRSGIESTNAELKSRHGAGNLRVRGEARVNMAMHLKATALNVKRATSWHAAQGPPGGGVPVAIVTTKASDERPPPALLIPPPPPPPPPRQQEGEARRWWRGLGRRLLVSLRATVSPAWAEAEKEMVPA